MIAPDRLLTYSLRQSPHGAAISHILSVALDAVDPGEAVRHFIERDGFTLHIGGKSFTLPQEGRIFIIAFGKASLAMAESLEGLLGSSLTGGFVISKHAARGTLGKLAVMEGGHPIPDERSLSAGRKVIDLLSGLCSHDLVFCLISGGGSAMMAAPVGGVTLSGLQSFTAALLASGAPIDGINLLRRHLDRLKGGGLARLASPARVISLILSDVVGDPLETIASGPTAPDPATCADALAVLDLYTAYTENTDFHGKKGRKIPCSSVRSVESVYHKNHNIKVPPSVLAALKSGHETLKPGDPLFERVDNFLVGSNLLAAQAALEQAEVEGFHPCLLRTDLQGEARQGAVELSRTLCQALQTGQPASRPACIVAGGETTVTLCPHPGRGGRNTELALASVNELVGFRDGMLVTLATDGEDGTTDAAGAVVTGETFTRANALGLDPLDHLRRNDSYTFFALLDDLLKPGPTGTNVNDLTFLFTF